MIYKINYLSFKASIAFIHTIYKYTTKQNIFFYHNTQECFFVKFIILYKNSTLKHFNNRIHLENY